MSTRGQNLRERSRRKREEAEQKVVAALLSAAPGGLTVSELVAVTGLSEHCVRSRIYDLRGNGKARVCDYRELRNVNVEAWGLGSAPSLTLEEWIAKRPETDVEREMRADIHRNHACWAAKWKPRRPAEAAWF